MTVRPFPIAALTFLCSLGTGILWNALYFIAEREYGFTQRDSLLLAFLNGVLYTFVAMRAGPTVRFLERHMSARSALGLVLLVQAAMAPLVLIPSVAVLWVSAIAMTALGALQWPIVQAYLAAGRHGAEMRNAIGWWNASWMLATAIGLALAGPLEAAQLATANTTAAAMTTPMNQELAAVSFAELVPYSADEQIVIMDLPDMVRGEHELLTDLSTEYEVPEFLESISNVRLLSLGGRPEGVQMSAHHSAWLAVIEGAKLWHLAPPNRPQPSNRYCPNRGKIDYELARREGVIHCMAYPGEVVVVPDNWWHATCNMLPYTIAVGGQTWDRSAGTQFGARGEA
jgi:hypothetical protein